LDSRTARGTTINITGADRLQNEKPKPPPECPFCDTNLTTDHIIWICKEMEAERNRINITSEVWKGGKKEMEKLITHVKKIQLYNGI
jgi:hypothetical protein